MRVVLHTTPGRQPPAASRPAVGRCFTSAICAPSRCAAICSPDQEKTPTRHSTPLEDGLPVVADADADAAERCCFFFAIACLTVSMSGLVSPGRRPPPAVREIRL